MTEHRTPEGLCTACSTTPCAEHAPLTGKALRKGTGDVLKDLEYAQRFVDGEDVAGMLGLELDFINRVLRVAHHEIRQLRARVAAKDAKRQAIAGGYAPGQAAPRESSLSHSTERQHQE